MQENKSAQARLARDFDDSSDEEIRVTDRRRINVEGEAINDGADDASDRLSGQLPSFVEQLKASKEAAEQKLVEVQSRFEQLRTQLQKDTDETRQRLNRAADDRAHREKADFITALLPVMDNLNRAIGSASADSFDAFLEGVRSTAAGFESALIAANLEPVQSVGEKFNPEIHEAVDTIEVEPDQDEVVTAEYSRGYRIGDRLLRPARVQVGRSNT